MLETPPNETSYPLGLEAAQISKDFGPPSVNGWMSRKGIEGHKHKDSIPCLDNELEGIAKSIDFVSI